MFGEEVWGLRKSEGIGEPRVGEGRQCLWARNIVLKLAMDRNLAFFCLGKQRIIVTVE